MVLLLLFDNRRDTNNSRTRYDGDYERLDQVEGKDGHELSAYVARPEGEAIGALVLVQEIYGVNAHIRSVADGYAKDGFLVVAPAIFDRFERGLELKYEGEDQKQAFELYPKLKPDVDAAGCCRGV